MASETPVPCGRPACESGLPAKFVFTSDAFEGEPVYLVFYCPPCVALNITQDWFSRSEVDSLSKI